MGREKREENHQIRILLTRFVSHVMCTLHDVRWLRNVENQKSDARLHRIRMSGSMQPYQYQFSASAGSVETEHSSFEMFVHSLFVDVEMAN